ncbi:hypothetical protein FRC02_006448 [Tulasnella sp. 418]|nr:hypothetical protein FRC02_006448 [Tulasnella sp. 418]
MIQQDSQKFSNGEVKPQEDEDSVDVGSMLASLPPASLLSLFTSLLSEKPELKPVIVNLLPRPTLETALQALNDGAKKLREAYPYSQPSFTSSSFGFGAAPAGPSQPGQSGSMRESYVRTRLRQPVRDFTKLALSYISYFSSPRPNNTSSSQRPPAVPLHPSETFTFLHCLSLHLLRLPPLTLAEFVRPSENILFPRIQQEWNAWVQKVDDDVNRWGGMYRDEVVRSWERALEELLAAEESGIQQQTHGVLPSNEYIGVKSIKDRWLHRVGWLIGRRMVGSAMDEGL